MKALFSRSLWLRAGGLATLLAVCSAVVHPFSLPQQVDIHSPPGDELQLPPAVASVLNRSCIDCHSNHTVWPWYSHVAPLSWLIERDVRGGRDRLNLSEWHRYTLQQRAKLLADIASAVKNREMPLPQYTLVHRQARLSDAETDIVYAWARAQRRTLKATSGFVKPAAQFTLDR
ncbi:MAG: heme-binding domain-containing protein [Acidobacteriota bacterium]|nr:heme-binding domain-containing protein [Acidobacteriota bacterium]